MAFSSTRTAYYLNSPFAPSPTQGSKVWPGRVKRIVGIIFQSDAGSLLGRIFIRPMESLDQWWAGLFNHVSFSETFSNRRAPHASLGMHAGIHVELEDGSEHVVEQLAGGFQEWFVNGLHWTPIESFRNRERRDRGGWDVTVPAQDFRQVDEELERLTVDRLNWIQGRPFIHEDCTGFISRAFGRRRIFADSPLMRSLGVDLRSGEPALPLIRRDAELPGGAEKLLHGKALRGLPDPAATSGSMSMRQLHHRLLITGTIMTGLLAMLGIRLIKDRRA